MRKVVDVAWKENGNKLLFLITESLTMLTTLYKSMAAKKKAKKAKKRKAAKRR